MSKNFVFCIIGFIGFLILLSVGGALESDIKTITEALPQMVVGCLMLVIGGLNINEEEQR